MLNFNQISALIQKFQQFQQGFKGDANQQIKQLLDSGKITQDQHNQALQMAQQLQKMLGK